MPFDSQHPDPKIVCSMLAGAIFLLLCGCTTLGDSGDRVVAVSDPENDRVSVRLVFGYDAAQVQAGTAWMAAQVLGGAYSLSGEQTLAELTALGATLNATAEREVLRLDFAFPRSSLEMASRLIAERLSSSPVDNSKLDELRLIQHATLDSLRREPEWLVRSAYWSAAYQGSPYALPPIGSDSAIERLGTADLKSFHERFITSGNYVLGMSGPIGRDDAKSLHELLLELLPSGEPVEIAPQTAAVNGLNVRVVELPHAQEGIVLVGIKPLSGAPDSTALVLAMSATLHGVQDASLTGMDQSLRVERGITDGVNISTFRIDASRAGVNWKSSDLTQNEFIAVLARSSPMNALYAVRIILKELTDLNSSGLTTGDIVRSSGILTLAEEVKNDAVEEMRRQVASKWMKLNKPQAVTSPNPKALTSAQTRQSLSTAFDPKHLWIIAVVPDGERFRADVLSGMTMYVYPDWVDRAEIRRLDQEYLSYRPFWQAEKIQVVKASELYR